MTDLTEVTVRGARILLVDDEPMNLAILRELLEGEGYRVVLAPSGPVALQNAPRLDPDLILLDVMMPEMDGFETCRRLRDLPETAHVPVLFVTARDRADDVLEGFQAGALDYITKPVSEHEVLARVRTHVGLYRMARQLREKNEELVRERARGEALSGRLTRLAEQESARWGLAGFVGRSTTVARVFEEIRLLQENTSVPVLITGESGTGKELIARAIHFGSDRRGGAFVPVNCAALPNDLAESLLFGHAKGAYTGATEDQEGHFESADGGTLFLDEIGEMPAEIQAKFLRVLEDGEVWRVGAHKGRSVSVRVLAATNADLRARIAGGQFRRDLFYRLAHFTVEVPPLRQRRDDIMLLADHFVRLFAHDMGHEPPGFEPAARDRLLDYDYPGNVRELKNVIERALIESRGCTIARRHLHFPELNGAAPPTEAESPRGGSPEAPMDIDAAVAQAERQVVERALELSDGNVAAAARLLGSNRNRLYRILRQEPDAADA